MLSAKSTSSPSEHERWATAVAAADGCRPRAPAIARSSPVRPWGAPQGWYRSALLPPVRACLNLTGALGWKHSSTTCRRSIWSRLLLAGGSCSCVEIGALLHELCSSSRPLDWEGGDE